MRQPWSLWLLIDGKDNGKYTRIVKELSLSSRSPSFEPHLTLFGRINVDPEPHFKFFKNMATKQKKISTKIKNIKFGTSYWKSFYIDIEKNTSLEALQKQMIAPINHLRDYLFDPHLSLAYGDADEMRYIAKEIHLERFISFNSVAIAFVPDNVDEWKIINKFEFNFDL
tara:strand:- start:587 stop:1093 length:507 start_codon:yes stop_codon:yes gene_type:complete